MPKRVIKKAKAVVDPAVGSVVKKATAEAIEAPELYLSVSEVARYLNVHIKTVYEYIKQGRFGDIVRLPKGEARISISAYNKCLKMLTEEHKYVEI